MRDTVLLIIYWGAWIALPLVPEIVALIEYRRRYNRKDNHMISRSNSGIGE